MRILIAEDDLSFRRLLEDKLASWGYEVVTADNGDAALRILLSDAPPGLALLDWIMPGVEGIDVCRKVREEVGGNIYIILLTSQQKDEDLVAGIEAGADDYITKPFKHNELFLRLRAGARIIELRNKLNEAHN